MGSYKPSISAGISQLSLEPQSSSKNGYIRRSGQRNRHNRNRSLRNNYPQFQKSRPYAPEIPGHVWDLWRDMLKTFNDFIDVCCEQIGLPDSDVRRCLSLHLTQAGITEQDVVLYINYPEYTEQDLAATFHLSKSAVGRALTRVRKAWPSLLTDPDCNQHGAPALRNMLRYVPSMDERVTVKF